MRTISTDDFNLLASHAQMLADNDVLALTLDRARLAIALMWDFPTWHALESVYANSPNHQSDTGTVKPSALMRDTAGKGFEDTTSIVLRQIGRLMNNISVFPKLTEQVGTVIPQLYGYDSLQHMSRAHPASLVGKNDPTGANGSVTPIRPTEQRVFTGAGRPGVTLVSGGSDDYPLAFILDETLQQVSSQVVRILVSQKHSDRIDVPMDNPGWLLESAPSLSTAVSQMIQQLHQDDNSILVLSLDGFSLDADLYPLMQDLREALGSGDGHIIVDIGQLKDIPAPVWEASEYQVMLSGALEGYPEFDNPLKLSIDVMNQVAGFTSNRQRDFTFVVMEDRAMGQLVFAGSEPLKVGQAQECSA